MIRSKIFLCLIVLIFFTFNTKGQVSIQLNPPIANSFSSADVWNMGVQYIGQTPVTVRFVGKVSDEKGKPLVSLISSNVILQPGLQLFNKNTLQTATLNYQNAYAGNYEKTSGQLPPGKLQYCVYVECMETPSNCIQKLNPENSPGSCQTLDLQPPTPLLLASPEDESKIKIKRPNFSWIPPMPIGQNPDLKYEMTLVKMNKKQKAEDAIVRNRPIYKEAGLAQTFLPFPANLTDLEIGEKYAWTVKAFLGDIFITQAEVWEFEVVEELEAKTFVNVHNANSGIHYCEDKIDFIFIERYRANSLNYKIIDSRGKEVCTQCPEFETIMGENKFTIEQTFGNMQKGQTYILVIKDQKGKKTEVKFNFLK